MWLNQVNTHAADPCRPINPHVFRQGRLISKHPASTGPRGHPWGRRRSRFETCTCFLGLLVLQKMACIRRNLTHRCLQTSSHEPDSSFYSSCIRNSNLHFMILYSFVGFDMELNIGTLQNLKSKVERNLGKVHSHQVGSLMFVKDPLISGMNIMLFDLCIWIWY